MITPTRFCNAPKLLPPDADVSDEAVVATAVAVASEVADAVAVAAAKISWMLWGSVKFIAYHLSGPESSRTHQQPAALQNRRLSMRRTLDRQ